MSDYSLTDVPENHFDGGANITRGSGKGPTLAEVMRDTITRVANQESAMLDPVATVAALRAVTEYTDKAVIFCEAKGLYYYESTSAAADDADLVIQPTAVTGNGRWLLQSRLSPDHETQHGSAGADALSDIPSAATIQAGTATIGGHWPDRTIYVDGSNGDDTYDGTDKEPLATIQAAITAAAALTPTLAAPVVIAVNAGTYTEDLAIHGDDDFSGLLICGVGGEVRVEAATVSALIVSNATEASIGAYQTAGGDPTPITGDLATLAAGANALTDVVFENISFGAAGSVIVDVQVIGLGAGVAFGTGGVQFKNCTIEGDLVTENVVTVELFDSTLIGQDVRFWNTNQVNMLRSNVIRNVHGTWDTAQDVPSVVTNLGLLNGYGGFVGGDITFDGGATAADGVNDPGNGFIRGLFLVGNIDIDDESSFFMETGYIGGAGDVEGDAVLRFTNVLMLGALTLVNAGGSVACAMNGGTLLGALTDAGTRLAVVNDIRGATTIDGVATRTLANLPVFTRELAIGHADLTAGAVSQVLSFASALPANAIPLGARIRNTTDFDDTGGTMTALTAQLGTTANPDLWLDTGNDILAGAPVDRAAAGDAFDGTQAPYPAGAITPVVTVTGNANLTLLTAGAMTAYLYYVIPQV